MADNEKNLPADLRAALTEARRGAVQGHGGPFGAVVSLPSGRIIARAHNTVLRDGDPTAHAEVHAIRRAARKLGRPNLAGCVLTATSEPCPLCLAAAYWAGIAEVRYAAPRTTAARFGFRDSSIYRELAKRPDRRRIRAVRLGAAPAVEDVFREWKRRGGKLY